MQVRREKSCLAACRLIASWTRFLRLPSHDFGALPTGTVYFLCPHDLLGLKERGRNAGASRSQGPCVFQFALLSSYLCQMENVPELAGGPRGGREGGGAGRHVEQRHPSLETAAQLCTAEPSSLPADPWDSPAKTTCPPDDIRMHGLW